MRTGVIVPAILIIILGSLIATQTFSSGFDWLTAFAMLVVAYGGAMFARALVR